MLNDLENFVVVVAAAGREALQAYSSLFSMSSARKKNWKLLVIGNDDWIESHLLLLTELFTSNYKHSIHL